MIVYLKTKGQFLKDVDGNTIEEIISQNLQKATGCKVGTSELNSWKNSLTYMQRVVTPDAIPEDLGVAIEFHIPQTSKRIDFILTGKSSKNQSTVIIVELKQWSDVQTTEKDAIVRTFLGKGDREVPHPSYQAWSYATLLEDFNETVRNDCIQLRPCAYLHNCDQSDIIRHSFYKDHISKAPAFLKAEAAMLREFIIQNVKSGDSGEVMYRIRDGKISPSKNLADQLVSLLEGNKEFLMIDDQKLVYETGLDLVKRSAGNTKHVLIVEGGPGTGKSVVAINLLVELTRRQAVVQYVTRNSAPRVVYESKLTGSFTKTRISNLFKGSGAYVQSACNTFDCLLIDEAHRLNEKSGMFRNQGINQIKEIIHSARCSIFFIDESQRVTFLDIGRKSEIHKWANELGAQVTELQLESQFRCNGADGYISWLDHILQIKQTATETLEGIDYEFFVCDSASELRDQILEKNRFRNKARMVAGYCWDWASKSDPKNFDIEFPEDSFSARWNLASDGMLWILKPDSVNEIGCIHTCQGLELDYVGVILGLDFIVREGVVVTDGTKRSTMDKSISGFKKLMKLSPDQTKIQVDEIVKNTYRTLMTRGQKGCFVYSVDPETNEYLKRVSAQKGKAQVAKRESLETRFKGISLRILSAEEVRPYINCVPIFDIYAAAGEFSADQLVENCGWVELPEKAWHKEGYFVAQVLGESMNKKIPNGSWCLWRSDSGGSRQGKVVLVQHQDLQDPNQGGQYTVKIYSSEKRSSDNTWEHAKITLKPHSSLPGFREIVFKGSAAGELKVIGEFVAVL